MTEQKQTTVRTLAEAFEALPKEKKEFMLGYAEGVIAARKPDEDAAKAGKAGA